jgi:hypothetical protein
MAVELKIPTKNGLRLFTKNKFIEDDIDVTLDRSLIPNGTLEVTENGEHDVTSYEKVNVAVAGSGESTLKKLLDYTKSTARMFYGNTTITDLTGLIEYNDTENVNDMKETFYNCSKLTTIPPLNVSNAKNLLSLFDGCTKLTSNIQLDIKNANTINDMFKSCQELISINLLNTNNINSISSAFSGCLKLKSLSQLDTKNVSLMQQVFNDCRMLEKIDITYFNCDAAADTLNICYRCYSLKAFVIREFSSNYALYSTAFNYCYKMLGQQHDTYNPNGEQGYVYVPRAMVETLSNETNWSVLQFRALEDYTVDGTTTGELDLAKMGL